MKAAGLDPAAVSTVVISHFHGDHISGLWVKETNAQVFPNAEIRCPRSNTSSATDPALVEKLPEPSAVHPAHSVDLPDLEEHQALSSMAPSWLPA